MITLRSGSHVHKLLQLLSATGEFPTRSLAILGNERFLKKLIHRLESPQELCFETGGEVYQTKLLQVSGKRELRTVRLYKGALPILDALHPDASEYYLNAFQNHRFPGDRNHIQRNHRVAEAAAMCMTAGIEMRPYVLPQLQKNRISRVMPDAPCFYFARDIKKLSTDELNKTIYTRVVGLLSYPGGAYAVYNTRDAIMKWSGLGEFKTVGHLTELVRMNAGLEQISSAILFGRDQDIALQTLIQSDKSRRPEYRFDQIYQHIHFIPMDENGIGQLKILTLPNWNEKLLTALFPDALRKKSHGILEHDAFWEDQYVYSHLDGDIARLLRLRQGMYGIINPIQIICFPWQVRFLKAYFGDSVTLRILEGAQVSDALAQ